MKRAQAAMEFLMTYGWAILVVLVAIGALAYFGVLSPEKFLPEKCVIASGSGLFCSDFSADDTPQITLQIHNILDKTVAIATNGIVVEFNNGLNVCRGPLAAANIASDATNNTILSSAGAGAEPCAIAQGDKIKGNIIITYTPAGGLTKSTTGQIVTTAGP